MQRIVGWIATHRKAIFGYLGLGATALTFASQHFGWHYTWIPVVLGVLAAIGVHAVPNKR